MTSSMRRGSTSRRQRLPRLYASTPWREATRDALSLRP
jgi:hypothetical protein